MIKKEDKRFCVYTHSNPQTMEIFYVGIGTKERPNQKYKRSVRWKNYVAKYGFISKVVLSDVDWDFACHFEKDLIKKLGRLDHNTGKLINMTEGGDGSIGYIGYWKGKKRPEVTQWLKGEYRHDYKTNPMPQEIRDKIAASLTGKKLKPETIEKLKGRKAWNQGMKGEYTINRKIFPPMHPNTKEALRKANTGRVATGKQKEIMSKVHKGKTFSPECRAKISATLKLYNQKRRELCQTQKENAV